MHNDQSKTRRLSFSRRMYPTRAAGLALGGVCVGVALYETGTTPWLWLVLGLSSLVWPHLAYLLARNSSEPV